MPWQWNLDSKRYHDSATGQFLSAEEVRNRVTERARVSGAATDSFAEMLRGGQINTRDWETVMRQRIKDEYVQQYELGKGGLSQMTPADWGSVGGMLADQYRYLGGFANEIAAGTLSEAQIAARSKMYINSGREAFERAQGRVETEADQVLWGLGAADHCEDCVGFAALGWQQKEPWPFVKNGRDAIPGSGDTVCLTNCKCAVEYRVEEPEEG